MVNECCIKGCQIKSSNHIAVSKENVKSFLKVPEDVSILWKMFVRIECRKIYLKNCNLMTRNATNIQETPDHCLLY